METLTDPVTVMARTLWGEARGEGIRGMWGVGNVVRNRANNPRWWGNNIVEVCLKAWQFSCWNINDPNRVKLLQVTVDDPQYAEALGLSYSLIYKELADITYGADSYADLRYCSPDWATLDRFTVKIGNQSFYKVELH